MPAKKFEFVRFGVSFRITAISVACVLIATLVVSLVSLAVIKRNMQTTLQAEQVARLTNIAQGIDGKFASRQITLKILAESLPKALLTDAGSLQGFLVSAPSLKLTFDNVSIFDPSGKLVANLIRPDPIGKINVSDREYFRRTIASNAGVISKPFKNRYSGIPQVAITQPVKGPDGNIVYVISAAINLQEDNFLGEFSNVKFGRTGYLFIMNADGTVIDHPDKNRILSKINGASFVNPPVKQALAGFEGAMEATSSYGVEGLYAYKRVWSTDWILGATYPTSEAFESITELQRRTTAYALILSVAAGLVTAWAMRRQLKPLLRLHAKMSDDARAPLSALVPGQYPNDEIGDIAKAYDALRQATYTYSIKLGRSEQHFRDILTHAGDAFVSLDVEGAITEWNRQAEETFGWQRDEVIGKKLETVLIPEEMRAAHVAGMKRFVATGTGPLINKRIELMALHRDGHRIAVELTVAASFNGIDNIPTAFIRDITARKQAERKLIESETFLRTITDNIPILIGYVDLQERYRFVNASYQKFFGVAQKAIVGMSMRELLGEQYYGVIASHIDTVKSGLPAHFERSIVVDQLTSHLMGDYIPDIGNDGTLAGFFIMVVDITARKNAEIGQALSEQRLQLITDNLPVMISYIDREHRLQFGNATFKHWLQVNPAAIQNNLLRDVIGEKQYLESVAHLDQALAGETVRFYTSDRFNGVDRDLQTVHIPHVAIDGSTLGVYTLTSDITAQKTIERQLFQLARVDSLTGLPNRRQFEEKLDEALARDARSKGLLALMFLDIDHFKAINDKLGHAAGDEVLIRFGTALRNVVRKVDVVARLAGDEFVVVLENLKDVNEANIVAEKILNAVARSLTSDSGALPVSTSIGIAFADGIVSADTLLNRADEALYSAKARGRNQFAVWFGNAV
ncbi:MAG: PAS domain S-box protein [Pseudomonadota bacterium]